jgi:hypothetical protein
MVGYNEDLCRQAQLLHEILKQNIKLYSVIEKSRSLGIENYYIGAGCITQTVWNYQTNNDLLNGVEDIDFIYFDTDLSYKKEDETIKYIKSELDFCGLNLDIKNQARVHIWYKEKFGYEIEPYESAEAAINSWPASASAVGVRLEKANNLKVYAPFGLNDMFGMIIKPNKTQITEEIYYKKANKWKSKWIDLKIIAW